MPYSPNAVAFVDLPVETTPVSAAWLNGVDAALVSVINDITLTGVGLVNVPRVVTWAPSGDASGSVACGNGGVILTAGNIPAPGHAIGGLFRWRHFSGTATEGYGVEGRVDHEGPTAVIQRGNAFVAIVGSNVDNAGSMPVFRGFKFPDFSGAEYSRVGARVFMRCEDPGAPIQTRGRVYGSLAIQLNGSSDTAYAGGEIAPPRHAGMVAGVRYASGMTFPAPDLAISPNLLYVGTVFVSERCTLNQLAFWVTVAGAGGTVARLSIHALVRGALGPKIAESAEVAVSVTGERLATVPGAVVLEPGQYAVTLLSNGAPTIRWISDYTLGGTLGTTNATQNDTLLFSAVAYGPIPSQPVLTRGDNSGWVMPWLALTVT